MGTKWGKLGGSVRVRLTPRQEEFLEQVVQTGGSTVADIVRRALDAYLDSATFSALDGNQYRDPATGVIYSMGGGFSVQAASEAS